MQPPPSLARDVLRQVHGSLPEVPRPSERARDGDRKDEGEQVAASLPPPRVPDERQYLQQPWNLPSCGFISAGRGGIRGMRNQHSCLSSRTDLE